MQHFPIRRLLPFALFVLGLNALCVNICVLLSVFTLLYWQETYTAKTEQCT